MSRFEGSVPSDQRVQARMHCQVCALSCFCLPATLAPAEVADLERIISRNRLLQKNQHLILAGAPARHVFALRSGAIKTYLLDRDGREQITGFILPGELVGIDAFGKDRYPSFALALETSLACVIPIADLEELAGRIGKLRKQLLNILSGELRGEQRHLTHSHESAEQRLAAFLLDLSERHGRRGLSASNFILPMSRAEIGNYLGLTTETVSRVFTQLRREGLILCRGRELRIQQLAALCSLGGYPPASRSEALLCRLKHA